MSGKVVVLRTTELMPIEAAAQILGWIVYPTKQRNRDRLANAIVLIAPREAARHDQQWQNESIPIKGGVLLLDTASAEAIIKMAWPTLRHRILAGNMALPLIAEAVGLQVKLAPDGAALSLNQIAARTAELIGGPTGGDERNVKARIWGPSRPVLHLCAAFALVMSVRMQDRWNGTLWGFLEDPDAIGTVIEFAKQWRHVIARWRPPRPTVNPSSQVEIQLVS